ncbi:Uncharacterised protein [Leminorella richardii]|uniref:SMI1 / KNR4 family n=1 Tax=Leminorella richardii TaxID=158841 RepID=A0A2X4UG34_9GAMM|nr:SMI1/KNR4 family protein [Leminorella richardii]SQI38856.1 Uncharacterised protein [Leminorella richardii]
MLLPIEEIERRLSEKFLPFDKDMDLGYLILKKKAIASSDIKTVEQTLAIDFPEDFKALTSDYDFDSFSLGKVQFSSNGEAYFPFLVEANQDNDFNTWWVGDRRPEGIVVIALTDPYTILLNTYDGAVYAMTSESSVDDFERIASNFSLFVCGVGTAFLCAGTEEQIQKAVGAQMNSSFWREMVN